MWFFADVQQQGSTYQPVPVFASVDFYLLMSLIELDTFRGIEKISDLQLDVLLCWLRHRGEEEHNYGRDDLKTLVKKIRSH